MDTFEIKPTERLIRDRVLKPGQEVIVFDRSFRIREDESSLCADPGSGQTPGFAHRLDLAEDPTLSRPPSYYLFLYWFQCQKILARVEILGKMALAELQKWRLPEVSIPIIKLPSVSLPKLSLPILSLPEIDWKRALGVAGNGLVVAAIVLLLMTVGPIIRLQAGEWWNSTRTAITGKASEPEIREVLTDTVRKPEEIPPEDKQFQLLIPKLNANMKVIPNVDAGNEVAYTDALRKGVAHAAGSGLPGEANATNKTVYIFGHSTNAVFNIARYNALFYSLKDLMPGDQIIVWFWGKEFKYQVSKVVKIDPLDLSYLQPQTTKDQLILQTCWPPGTTWKRLLVIASPLSH